MERQTERRLLQLAVALAAMVPLTAGALGVVDGPSMAGGEMTPDRPALESHFRYLSGLLLGIGIAFALSIPTIERRSELFAVLSATVFVGGLARMSALFIHGMPTTPHLLALVMELVAVPSLFAWQRRVARRFRS